MKPEQAQQRIHIDLEFLLNLKKETLNDQVSKYLIKEGISENTIGKELAALDVIYNFSKYDYYGKFIDKNESKTAKVSSSDSGPIKIAIDSMKLYEEAWFNIKDPNENEEGRKTGYHYRISVEQIKYKNTENIHSKKMVYEQNREKGKQYFTQQKYDIAIQIYKHSVNITQNVKKTLYSQEECKELEEMNISSMKNVLKCFAKLKYNQERHKDLRKLAQSYLHILEKKTPEDYSFLYLKAKFLFAIRYLTDSLAIAKKSYELQKEEDTLNFIKQIQEEISNKSKLKTKKQVK